MKKILNAVYSLFFFRSTTKYERWFEIGAGIIAWTSLFMILLLIF